MAEPAKGRTPAEIEVYANILKSMRYMLSLVPSDVFRDAIATVAQDQLMGPMLDPTAFQDQDKFRDLKMHRDAAQKIIELKDIWGQP